MKIDEAVEKYIALRDKKAQMKKACDEKVAKIDAVLDKIEAALLKFFDASGQESAKTQHGTAYTQLRESVTVASRDDYFDFVKEEDRWDMLESRANKIAVLQYKEEHGELPPGLNYRAERIVNIRRGK
jgi:hypothetical protein